MVMIVKYAVVEHILSGMLQVFNDYNKVNTRFKANLGSELHAIKCNILVKVISFIVE